MTVLLRLLLSALVSLLGQNMAFRYPSDTKTLPLMKIRTLMDILSCHAEAIILRLLQQAE